ncbi:UDP-2,3-diacylglucosamine diphosphatase [Pontibacter cellulosilyticus]|uniref:UDP-2,3-diacylglucosamine diphosphatase n=1 Tax=Pontibacter cellulosilyticus TaxID=1720253 RepID=A0A923SJN4_9BACT|nr:UDP-2,3-diacylglucosamine diphosphatase [Pontibacter cellulosilyticus]MBC5993998.1 UDP-2,3-diacylglucosamine diphosphatase [Pontibacter cellulosilyticus]
MARKRKVEVVVISDVHLGTYGCHAKELLAYLKSIKPDTIILNGDIIDIWQFSKSYWPASHMRVVKYLMGLIAKGTNVYYITGNHDEMLRKFVGFKLGTFQIVNKLVLELDGKRAWMFHGDVFDVTMQHSKWLAKLGAQGYDLLILLNRMVNFFCLKLNREKVYISRNIKNRVKSAVKFINNFEKTASDIAISNGYDYVVCGHIHQPELREITNNEGCVTYLNSGDWIENLTAMEYDKGAWSLYKFRENLDAVVMDKDDELVPTNIQLFQSLMVEFNLKSA